MKEILSELTNGNQVIIETDKLPYFLEYVRKQKAFHTFRYEYQETTVKITLIERWVKL